MSKRILVLLCSTLWLFATDVSFADTVRHSPKTSKPTAISAQSAPLAAQAAEGFPVVFADVEIFRVVTSPIGSLTPENRAQLILENIQNFADSDMDFKALKVISLPEGRGIGHEDSMLMVVTQQDAAKSGVAADVLSMEILVRIQAAVETYRTKHAWKTYGLGALFTLLSIAGLWLALYWNARAFAWLIKRASTLHDAWTSGVRFKGVEVLSAKRLEGMTLIFLKSLRNLIVLLCLYFFLPLILSFFPETHKLSLEILDYFITPFITIFHTIVKYIPNLFYIFVIGIIAFYVLKVVAYAFQLVENGKLKFDWFYADWARPTYQILRFLVIVTALISAYPYIPGSSSAAFQGVGLVLGALISFASSSAISNIVAGIILTYTRAFRLNDRVKIGETTGDVVEKTLLVTRINTIKQVIVTIPNSLVMATQIINYSTSADDGDGVILHTSVTIGYDVPWKQVQTLLHDAALATGHILKKPEPFVLQTSLDDWYVSYEINAYTKKPEIMAGIYSELHKNILEKFDAAGVEIMSPHYYAVRDGNASTVPSVLGAVNYTSPAFRVDKGV